ncbi:unnamed protein product [Closterium sp. NIES-53]
MVDGTKLPIHGKSTLQLQIGALRWKPTLPITSIKGLDFILGRDFLKRFNPEIDWVSRKTCIYNNRKRVELRSWTDTGSVPETTLARFEWTVTESNTGYLALVMEAAEEEVLEQYKDIMPDDLPAGVPPARTHEHEIVEEPRAKPVSRAPYRLSPTELTDMKKQIEYLLDRQLIRPSTSPYGAPFLFTPKPDSSLQMCINYRALNKQTTLTTAPVLILPDPDINYVVEADASDRAVGAVLMQHHERSLQPITYLSKKLLQWKKDLAVRKGSGKIWVPHYAPLRQILLEEFHDVPYAGHFGSNKTLAGIAKYYYWPRMAADVQQFVTSCDTCQQMKSSKQNKTGLLQPLPVPEQPWQVVSLDFITGLPSTSQGHDSILVVIDKFSKIGHYIPTNATGTAEATARLFFDHNTTMQQLWEKNRRRLTTMQTSQKQCADRQRRDHSAAVGDQVLLPIQLTTSNSPFTSPLPTPHSTHHFQLPIQLTTANSPFNSPLPTPHSPHHCQLPIQLPTANSLFTFTSPLQTPHSPHHCQLPIHHTTENSRFTSALPTHHSPYHCQLPIQLTTVNSPFTSPLPTPHSPHHCQLPIQLTTANSPFTSPLPTPHSPHDCQLPIQLTTANSPFTSPLPTPFSPSPHHCQLPIHHHTANSPFTSPLPTPHSTHHCQLPFHLHLTTANSPFTSPLPTPHSPHH